MPGNSSSQAGEEYLVAARASGPDAARTLQEVAALVAKLPGAAVVQSKAGASHLVVRLSAQHVDTLRTSFGQRVIIEPNAALRL